MSLTRRLPGLLALMLVFSGCVATPDDSESESEQGTGEEAAEEEQTSEESSEDEGEEGNGTPSSEPGEEFEAPVVSATVTGEGVTESTDENGTVYSAAPLVELTFDASSSSDPAGGILSFVWDLGDGTMNENVSFAFNYSAAGNYTVNVTATSDTSGLSNAASVNLSIVEAASAVPAGRQPVEFVDPSNDGGPTADVRAVRISDDGTKLAIQFGLDLVQPGNGVYTVACWNFHLNGNRYEAFGNLGSLATYGYTEGGNVQGVTYTFSGNTVTAFFEIATLEMEFPMTVFLTTRTAECLLVGGQATLDRAPNAGEVVYG